MRRQLMRKVSGLGMEDPVFAAAAAQTKPKRSTNIFDDMNLEDVPEDMRDMFSLASDRTDSVDLDDDILESPVSKPVHPGKKASLHNSWRAFPNMHASCSSLPPLGLNPNASPTQELDEAKMEPKFQSFVAPPPPPPPPPPSQMWSAKSTGAHRKSNYVAPPPVAGFTPPSGTFLRKKPSKLPGNRRKPSALIRDDRLAAQVDAMFQQSMSNLELSSDTLNYSKSSLQESFNNSSNDMPTSRKASTHNKARNRDSDRMHNRDVARAPSTRASVYVPPGSGSANVRLDSRNSKNEFQRTLPSMDSLYPDAKPACRSPLPPPRGYSPPDGMAAIGRKSAKPAVITVKKSRRNSAAAASPSYVPSPVASPRFHHAKTTSRSRAQRRGTASSATFYTADTDAAAAIYHQFSSK
ncbi:MAG: hypothetical protein SGILL_008480 [Bacillariaceae sp.]